MTLAGAQVSSLRPYLQTEADVQNSFQKLRRMGYRVVQLQWLAPSLSPDFIAGALLASGLQSVSTQDYFDAVEADWGNTVRLHQLCGSRHVCVSGIPGGAVTKDECLSFVRRAGRMIEALRPLDMVLSFHPRSREFAPVAGQTAVDFVLAQLPQMMLGLDCYHAFKAGADVEALLRRYRGRVDFVHFKDFILDPDGKEHLTPVGQGCVDWAPVIAACRDTGVPWVFAEQETWEKDAFDCMAESLGYLKSQGLPAENSASC